ncbi:MAG TPA: SMP-30/gluconolactonase/LRE family protein [Candidatus Acidoferrales bacterium]|nr:SMP-30/gluconolactonase/LRE family protein [Candidatus Acidoferrales bacterium]
MNSKLTALNAVCFCACLVCATAVSSGLEAQTRPAETPATSTVAKYIPGVIKGGTKIEVVIATVPGHGAPGATGQGTEGPISLSDGTLAFCETNLGRVAKVDQNGHESVLIDESQAHAPNGLSWDSKGRLIGATTAAGHTGVAAIYPNGSEAVLADKFENKAFVRPNDLIVAKNGGIYFTDPANLPNPALPPAVYYIPAEGGKVIKVADGIEFPNGVSLSLDEKILYVNNTQGEYILAFDVNKDGTLRNRRNFAKYEDLTTTGGKVNGGGDGFTVDAKGRIYAAAGGSVQVFSPQGKLLGKIPFSRRPQNLTFAGPDMKTLYVVGGGSVFKVRTEAQGIRRRGGK